MKFRLKRKVDNAKKYDEEFASMNDESFLGENNVASTMECTGLMYNLPQNQEETESYKEIVNVPKQNIPNELGKAKNNKNE